MRVQDDNGCGTGDGDFKGQIQLGCFVLAKRTCIYIYTGSYVANHDQRIPVNAGTYDCSSTICSSSVTTAVLLHENTNAGADTAPDLLPATPKLLRLMVTLRNLVYRATHQQICRMTMQDMLISLGNTIMVPS